MIKIPESFMLGTSSSGWQIEGNFGKTVRQESWADLFYKTDPQRWFNAVGPDVASDFFHHYEEDIVAMAAHGLNAFRFSIQWARFMEDPLQGIVSSAGADFYHRVIDCILAHGMQPVISLEHWDIPAVLFDKYGGWVGRETVELYERYVEAAMAEYHNKVKLWFAFTEPSTPIDNGYMDAIWYPFRHDPRQAYQAHFHKTLATARAVKVSRRYLADGCKMGAMMHLTPVYSRSNDSDDLKAAHIADLLYVRLYLDPYLKGAYPDELFDILRRHDCMFAYTQQDLTDISQNRIDVLGVDYYFPIRVAAREMPFAAEVFHPTYYYEPWCKPDREFNSDRGWEIYPKAIEDFGLRIKEQYDNFPWFVSENGIGIAHEERFRNHGGMIEDDYRIDFIRRHLGSALKARANGANCLGYFIWSFVDNLSPLNAFKNRYGLLEMDVNTHLRKPKKSLLWLKERIGKGMLGEVEAEEG